MDPGLGWNKFQRGEDKSINVNDAEKNPPKDVLK
jgi:hypothetical protein